MTWRARAYLLVLTLRHFGVGLLCLTIPEMFTSTSYEPIRRTIPLPVWGALLVVIGVHAALAVVWDSDMWGRVVLIGSATLTGAWAAGFMLAALAGQLDSPPLPIMWTAFTLKDLIVSGMAFRLPLEEVARRNGVIP